ncbi:hypothetical protein PybrP1_011066 [[Pythium] brassicae (nom. inval.)]|nr:hypothetical protein PybrP1_011066 [[Pythium] brassicae (nom. inval.)]
MVATGSEVGTAFALNIAAGFATILGGMVVFSKRLVHLANPIFGESVHLLSEGIATEGMTEETATGHGWLAATACFGFGILLIYGIDFIIHKIAPETAATEIENLENLRDSFQRHEQEVAEKGGDGKSPGFVEAQTPNPMGIKLDDAARARLTRMVSEGILFGIVCGIMVCICVKELLPTAFKFARGQTQLVALGTFVGMFIMVTSLILFGYAGVEVGTAFALTFAAGFATVFGGMVIFSKRLVHLANPVSLAIALSISSGVMLFISLVEIFGESVHLLTEGIATKDMTKETAKGHAWLIATACFGVGIVLIYAIDFVVHGFAPDTAITEWGTLENIRRSLSSTNGDCTDSPVYLEAQAPGFVLKLDEAARAKLNKMGILSAPLGGLIAWLAIGDGMDPVSEGILFGIVCGIMVCICVKELLPTAFKFALDRTHVVAMGMFVGMLIMVTSLIMFAYAGVEVSTAFALNIAAGFATILGGMVVFSKRLVHLANPIFGESVHLLSEGIATEGMTEETATGHGWLVATMCFLGGIFLIYGIDFIIHKVAPETDATEIDNLENLRASFEQHEQSKSPGYIESQTPGVSIKLSDSARAKLNRMGVLSALAIGIHNLPEGIATYVGAIQNTLGRHPVRYRVWYHGVHLREGAAADGVQVCWRTDPARCDGYVCRHAHHGHEFDHVCVRGRVRKDNSELGGHAATGATAAPDCPVVLCALHEKMNPFRCSNEVEVRMKLKWNEMLLILDAMQNGVVNVDV